MNDLRRCNPNAVILPAAQGNIPFAVLDSLHTAWLDAQGQPPSHIPRLHHMNAQSKRNHADEGFASFCLNLPQPVSAKDIERMVDCAGPGLCRAKGIVNLYSGGTVTPAVAQYAAGRLEFEEAPDESDERYMVFIGVNLAPVHAPDSPPTTA